MFSFVEVCMFLYFSNIIYCNDQVTYMQRCGDETNYLYLTINKLLASILYYYYYINYCAAVNADYNACTCRCVTLYQLLLAALNGYPRDRKHNPHSVAISSSYRHHKQAKKRECDDWVREVEQASFIPLLFAITGGTGEEATADC